MDNGSLPRVLLWPVALYLVFGLHASGGDQSSLDYAALGEFMMRTETELVLKSRWVLPRRLQEEGYDFQRSTFDEALDELVKRGE